jgi:4-amino-4-deoxy-L-arabinose transferase-like glycosyltransferase
MFFPLVVLVAVLPGLYALNSWDLTPPGPWWGLRGLAVLNGQVLDQVPSVTEIKPAMEARAFRMVALQPPLYAWLEAVGLALSPDRDPRATVLPSYVAGVLVVVLVYLHGRLWRGPGLGLIAAVLVGFNRSLLVQMQQATPTTLGLLGILTALLCYGKHLRVTRGESPPRWAWGGAVFWMVLGGIALGLSLMAVGLFGLVVVPIVLLHQAYLRVSAPPVERERLGRWLFAWRNNPNLLAGAWALALALVLAVPWHVRMLAAHGSEVLGGLIVTFDTRLPDGPGLLERLILLAPATLPLGLYAAVRMVRLALIDENENREIVGGVFWVMWLAVAALVPAFWTSGPRPIFGLFLLVPLSLLAARAITDLANRSVPVRTLTWLAPLTAVSIAWWISANLRGAIGGVLHGRADAATALGLHLAFDLLVAVVLVTKFLDRWARRRDDRQRQVLGGFLAVVLAVTVGSGIREVWFRHRETDDLLMLRTMILRRDRERPFDLLAVVSPESYRVFTDGPSPGGRLRFILQTALPRVSQRDLSTTDDLLSLPEGQRLVILAGTEQRLPYAIQSKLGLEAIHPGRSGVLDAFATAHDPSRPSRR